MRKVIFLIVIVCAFISTHAQDPTVKEIQGAGAKNLQVLIVMDGKEVALLFSI